MPLSLSKIANNEASTSLKWGDDTVNITYYPARVTEKTFATMQSFANMDEDNISSNFDGFNTMIAQLLKSWDVYEDDEQKVMYPIVPDRLAELPIMFRNNIVSAILQNIRPEAMAPKTLS